MTKIYRRLKKMFTSKYSNKHIRKYIVAEDRYESLCGSEEPFEKSSVYGDTCPYCYKIAQTLFYNRADENR